MKYLLIHAICSATWTHHQGQLLDSEWMIYSDRSFILTKKYMPTHEQINAAINHQNRPPQGRVTTECGFVPRADFLCIIRLINKQWRNPDIHVAVLDGAFWQVEAYSEDGSIINTSGKPTNIYGHANLETLTSMLPMRSEKAHSCQKCFPTFKNSVLSLSYRGKYLRRY